MQFQGQRLLSHPADVVFARLSDAAFLAAAIPDASPAGSPTADVAECSVRPGVSFVRGSLDVRVTVVSRQAPTQEPARATFQMFSKGIGSTADVEAALSFLPEGAGTKIDWTATITKLGGLLKAVPAGLIRGAAQKVIDDVWAGIEAKLAEP